MTPPSLPIGGTTGLSHEHSAAVEECARFLLAVPPGERPRPLIPAMREMFGLTPAEACEAIKLSHDMRRAEH